MTMRQPASMVLAMTATPNPIPGLRFLQSGSGITFTDLTTQTTAAVTQINLGVGFANIGAKYGPTVGLDTTDVHTLISDSYTLQANDDGNNNITLHLTQELSPNSSPTFSNVTVGNLTVNGTTTTINSTTLNTTEKNLVISNTATPTDVTANGAGVTIKGATDKTFNWYSSTGALTSPEIVASNGLLVHSTTVSTSYSIPSGSNAIAAGPMTVASGASVTIPSGSRWLVL